MVVSEATEMAIDEFTIRYNPLLINKVADTTMVYKKVGAAVNSALDDSYPILSADGMLMFFSRTTNRGSIGIEASTLMYSEFNDSIKEWSQAKSLPKEINQGIGNPQVIYISADKNTLIVNASYDDNGRYIKPEGVSVFYRNKQGWSAPEKIIIEEFENRSKREAYAFSANNQIMILSVQTKNGYGERDLYVSFKKKDRWTKPKNLGQVVNSFSNDYSPCLAPDNVTLYYSSSGKPGYGKSDIFMTRRLDDTWLNWSEPKNLGSDINSPLHDSGLQVDAHGQYAYMNDYSNEIQKGEICRIKIPESAKPKPVVIVKGKVYDKLTNEPFSASIIYENLEKNIREGVATSSPEDGSYTLVLPYGINYGLLATAKGYLSESKNIDIKDSLINGFIEMTIDLYLTPLNVGQTLILNTIFFEEDKFELKETSMPELNRLYEIMLENSHMMLEIAGHTDFGTVSANEQELLILSTKRAEVVKKILVSKGILETRITVVGYGRSRPIISGNDSRNRRVEVKILKL
jgi:outer membrane protein OmpA-like peptidoglycan-associated protein